jgi:Ca-activated chloride channel family protein
LETRDGDVEYSGVGPSIRIATAGGNVRVTSTWRAMRLRALNDAEPRLVSPKGLKLNKTWTIQEPRRWMMSDNKSAMDIAYGTVFIQMAQKKTLELIDAPFPVESPVKPPWVAATHVESVLRATRGSRASSERPRPADPAGPADGGDVVFRSDVRLVNLSMSIKGPDGKPVPGLKPGDFEVLEDGVPQKVDFAGAEEVNANVAFLIDLSGSTLNERGVLKDAVSRFLNILGPRDKAALYAIANDLFYVLARLGANREVVTRVLSRLGRVSGGSPVYDCIWLSYAEELDRRRGERNALIVISDGVDNQLDGSGFGSETRFKDLRDALAKSEVLVYPVLLDPFSLAPAPARNRTAAKRMEELAQVTGGRVFPARSLSEMLPVIEQVGDEMRSLYSVAYRPSNQEFKGEWRKVEVRLRQQGLKLRARAGYYAR